MLVGNYNIYHVTKLLYAICPDYIARMTKLYSQYLLKEPELCFFLWVKDPECGRSKHS